MSGPVSAAALWPRPGRLFSWMITAVLVGWFVVYNVMRVGGGTPAGVALVSFLIGAVVGIVVLVLGVYVRRALVASGRIHPVDLEADIPTPQAMDDGQRRAVGLAWPVTAAAAVVEMALGLWMLADWWSTPGPTRATAELVMAGWLIFAALWMSWEARNLRDLDAGGVDSVALGALLSSVLAGVGISRAFATPGQVVMVVVGGVASVICYWVVWRLTHNRGVPTTAIAAGIVTVVSLLLPLLTR